MNDFWDFFWLLLWSFVFIAYLIILFQIIGDLFRDHELSGWWKAIWIIFLIIVPFLTALVYVIVRGAGMARRQAAAVQQAREETDKYIQTTAGDVSPAHQIEKAKALLDSGAISQEEYDQLKAKALS